MTEKPLSERVEELLSLEAATRPATPQEVDRICVPITLFRELAEGWKARGDALERAIKERQGAMHSSETWELMHAKRHAELEETQHAMKELMDVLMKDGGTIPALTPDCAKAWKRCKAALSTKATK